MQRKRVMRFIGNRPVPEPELFANKDPMIYYLGIDWGQKTPKSMSLVDLREFSKTCPNPLDSDFPAKTAAGSLAMPIRTHDDEMFSYLSALFTYPGTTAPNVNSFKFEESLEEEQEEPEQFEVNLTEPLIGWRRWMWSKPIMSNAVGLRSFNTTVLWRPCELFEAKCHAGWPSTRKHHKDLVPTDNCTCGVYAVDDVAGLPGLDYHTEVNVITGLVYGWGRYVRGEHGWRCQFAYPKEFHLRSFQAHLIDLLKMFRVPITIDEPLKIYDPLEDGYASGTYEANRDLGTSQESDSTED